MSKLDLRLWRGSKQHPNPTGSMLIGRSVRVALHSRARPVIARVGSFCFDLGLFRLTEPSKPPELDKWVLLE